VASGSRKANLEPVLKTLEAYAANFENGARRNALLAASQAVSIIKIDRSVQDRLIQEINQRIDRASPMSL
jgi:hypothetical protein